MRPVPRSAEPGSAAKRRYRRRSLANFTRMGHCAPAVMRTILDVQETRTDWPVLLTAGFPGGIGNTGNECGGITAPLVALGLRHGLATGPDGLPVILDHGHDLCRRFTECHGTLLCRNIRRDDRVPLQCVMLVRRSPERYAQAVAGDGGGAVAGEKREAYGRLYGHFLAHQFHCAQTVLRGLRNTMAVSQDLLDAASAFMGGTLFQGMTCGALVAGIMAMGIKRARIENSRMRVMRMIALMAMGGDAFADGVNEFNKIMNAGNRMAEWFAGRFGSTQCRDITNCDFSERAGVQRYVDSGGVARCRSIAQDVVEKVP